MLYNFDVWDIHTPCTQNQSEVTLVFFISRDVNLSVISKLILQRASQSSWATECFKSIEVTSANMTKQEDSYWLGSRVQFEKFLCLQFLSTPSVVRYVMYMEPDVYIFRPDWLPLLQHTAVSDEQVFFIKGHRSMPRFNLTYNHINGNALYNLGDARLSNFYFHVYSPLLKVGPGNASRYFHYAYDMDIHHFLDVDERSVCKTIRAHTLSSEFIQNYFHMNYSVAKVAAEYPTAFMIHGGYRQEEEEVVRVERAEAFVN